jgi:hypothetical protein
MLQITQSIVLVAVQADHPRMQLDKLDGGYEALALQPVARRWASYLTPAYAGSSRL